MWTARRILKELADTDLRRRILTEFWKHGDQNSRLLAQLQLAKAMNFREASMRKLPAEKKADLLASRIGANDYEQFLEMALMAYHTHHQSGMMAAFLDEWKVPHEHGSIESDDYTVPTTDQVREAAKKFEGTYARTDIVVYLASAGLLMADQWRDATWPVVDEMSGASA